jgi:hypothetical protein
LKVAINFDGGYRNRFTFCLTGLDIEEKAALVERSLWAQIPGGRESIKQSRVDLVRTDRPDPLTNEQAVAQLRFTVKDPDERKIGRAFSNAAIEMALATYPGMFGIGGPSAAEPYGVYWPALVPADQVHHLVTVDGVTRTIVMPGDRDPGHVDTPTVVPPADDQTQAPAAGPTERLPLGTIAGARSGDKGGNANVGVWTEGPGSVARDRCTADPHRSVSEPLRA